jgi:cell division protein FtsB
MNSYEMVAIIVAVVMFATVLKARYRHRAPDDSDPVEKAEAIRLRDEVKQLKERIHVLERITTDRENSLAREIDDLRDR